MKKLVASFALFFACAGAVLSNTGGIAWDKAPDKSNDVLALQHGAKLFVNYCLNCHSAAYMRFNRLKDIGLTEQQIKDNLLFTTEKVGDTMKAAIDPRNAKDWFGGNPPDLTLIARSRSSAGQGFIALGRPTSGALAIRASRSSRRSGAISTRLSMRLPTRSWRSSSSILALRHPQSA